MVEEDYIMRLIKEMVRTILKLMFDVDTENPTEDLLETQEEKDVYGKLCGLMDAGEIDTAEDELYELLDDPDYGGAGDQKERDMSKLKFGLLFYSYLNEKGNRFLEAHDFSREEIKAGMQELEARYGLSGITDVFIMDR